jgi:hypothetical protein
MDELLQFLIVAAFGGLCFGCSYLIAFLVTQQVARRNDQAWCRPLQLEDW